MVSLGTWQHVVVEYDNSSTANDPLIYINGVLQTVVQDASGGTPIGAASSDADQDLVMGNFLLDKEKQRPLKEDSDWQKEFELD